MLKKLVYLGLTLSLTSCTKAPEYTPQLSPNVQPQRYYDESGQFSFLIPAEFHDYKQTYVYSDTQGVVLAKASDTALCLRTYKVSWEDLNILSANPHLTKTILQRGLSKDLAKKKDTEKLLKKDQIIKLSGIGNVGFSYREICEPNLPHLVKGVFVTIHREKLIEIIVYCPAEQIASGNPEDFFKDILTYTLKSFRVESTRPDIS